MFFPAQERATPNHQLARAFFVTSCCHKYKLWYREPLLTMVADEMIPSEAGCLAADCFGELWKKKTFCLACEARRSQVKKGGISAKTIFHRGRFASWR